MVTSSSVNTSFGKISVPGIVFTTGTSNVDEKVNDENMFEGAGDGNDEFEDEERNPLSWAVFSIWALYHILGLYQIIPNWCSDY